METKENVEEQKKAPLTVEEAKMRKHLIADKDGKYNVEYNLFLVIRRGKDKEKEDKYDFEGKIEVTFTFNPKENEEVKEGALFLNFVGMIHDIKINGKEDKGFVYKKHQLLINTALLEENKENKMIILFKGMYKHNGAGLHHYLDPVDQREYLYTQFEPYDCNQLFPCFDQPDLKANLHMTVLAPEEWVVLTNDKESEAFNFTTEESLSKFFIQKEDLKFLIEDHQIKTKKYKLTDFKKTPKISTYLYALCAGSYHCIESKLQSTVPLKLYLRESMKNYGEPDEMFRVTNAGFKFYESYFGTPFPFSKYDQIFCPEYNMGAMENVGLITFNELYCWKDKPVQRRRAILAITVLHELAHMWFGNLVTMTWWDDLWLNEAFATFISHLCMAKSPELNDTYTDSWVMFCDYKGSSYSEDQKASTHPVMCDIYNTEVAETSFDVIVYEKGSSMLKQMYYYIGDEIFSKGLKTYFADYKWQNTVFSNLIDKMVAASDNKLTNLPDLCASWLKKAGVTELSLDMEVDDKDTITKFIVKQDYCMEAHPNLQSQMIDILFMYDFNDASKNKVYEKIFIEAKQETVIPSIVNAKAPLMILLNYNDWGYMKIVIDRRTINNLKAGINKLDILSKQLIYRSLFDSVRDGKLASIEYLEILLSLIEEEKNSNIRSSLLRYINALIESYIPMKYSSQYKSSTFDKVLSMLSKEFKESTLNMDIIKQLLSYVPTYASSDTDRNILIEILKAEKPTIKGTPINLEMFTNEIRLRFITAIHVSKTISAEEKAALLKIEMDRNNNDNESLLTKLTCYALTGTAEVKKELWNKFVNEPTSDSLYNMIALMNGFAPMEHEDLVKDYLKTKFFEVICDVGKKNTFFYAEAFVDNLGPSLYVEEEIIAKMEKTAEEVKDMPQIRKLILSSADSLKVRLKAHKLCDVYMSQKK